MKELEAVEALKAEKTEKEVTNFLCFSVLPNANFFVSW